MNKRGSPEVVEKRRAARAFNDLLMGRRAGAGDGRTERRRRRLLDELAAGKARGGKRDLTPVDVLSRVAALLELGETVVTIEAVRPRPTAAPVTDELVQSVRRIHEAYAFPVAAYAFVGVDSAVLKRAGVRQATEGLRPGLRRSTAPAPRRQAPGGVRKASPAKSPARRTTVA